MPIIDTDQILLRDPIYRGSLKPKYTGPYKVLRLDLPVVAIEKDGKEQRVNIDRCQKYYTIPDLYSTPSTKDSMDLTTYEPAMTRPSVHLDRSLPVPNIHLHDLEHNEDEPQQAEEDEDTQSIILNDHNVPDSRTRNEISLDNKVIISNRRRLREPVKTSSPIPKQIRNNMNRHNVDLDAEETRSFEQMPVFVPIQDRPTPSLLQPAEPVRLRNQLLPGASRRKKQVTIRVLDPYDKDLNFFDVQESIPSSNEPTQSIVNLHHPEAGSSFLLGGYTGSEADLGISPLNTPRRQSLVGDPQAMDSASGLPASSEEDYLLCDSSRSLLFF